MSPGSLPTTCTVRASITTTPARVGSPSATRSTSKSVASTTALPFSSSTRSRVSALPAWIATTRRPFGMRCRKDGADSEPGRTPVRYACTAGTAAIAASVAAAVKSSWVASLLLRFGRVELRMT